RQYADGAEPDYEQLRTVAGTPGVDEELVLVDQVEPVEFRRQPAAADQHTSRRVVLERLHARAEVAGQVMAVVPGEDAARRRHDVLGLGVELDRPLAHGRGSALCAAGPGRPRALPRSV